jgi:L-lactate dehydrogenase complex protein LldG
MSSRDTILQRIRGGLAETGAEGGPMPPAPEVWPRETSDPAALALRFANELAEVQGEVVRCATIDEARQRLVEIIDGSEWPLIGAVEHPLSARLTAGLPPERVAWADPAWQPSDMASLPAGLVAAEKLLADTGSCLVACRTAQERMMCYLPPACVVAARAEQLAEHMPAAWDELAPRAGDKDLRGEWVIITGPSRTADIEKILILGVHGPKRLIVLLID